MKMRSWRTNILQYYCSISSRTENFHIKGNIRVHCAESPQLLVKSKSLKYFYQFLLIIRFGCWPACCWSSYLWWSMPSFSGHLSCSVLISSTVMKLRRIVIHQRNLEKWRQEQLKEKKNESTTEVKKYQSQTNLIPSAEQKDPIKDLPFLDD